MKKVISLLLVLTMVCALAVGCANNNADPNETTTQPDDETTASADETTAPADDTTGAADETTGGAIVSDSATVQVLADIWALYGEDEKFFAIGGDMMNPVDNAPGVYSLEDQEAVTAQLLVPADQIAQIDEAASLIHAMNTNTFTGAAFHLVEGADAEAFAKALRDAVMNNQWMCGFPDKLIIAAVDGEYVLMAFGVNDAMNPFQTKLAEAHPEAKLLYEEAIA